MITDFVDRDGKPSTTCEVVRDYDYGRGRVCMMAPGHDMVVTARAAALLVVDLVGLLVPEFEVVRPEYEQNQ